MTEYVPGIIVLVGKVAFLVALYGFVLVVFRGLMVEAKRAGRPAPRMPAGAPAVDRWELRPAQAAGVTLHPPVPPVLSPPPLAGPAVGAPDLVPSTTDLEPVIELRPPSAPILAPAQTAETAAEALDQAPVEIGVDGDAAAQPEAASEPAIAPEPAPIVAPEPVPEPEPEPEPEPLPVLVVLASPEANLERGARLELAGVARLGRADDNDIILRDRFVSGHHAEVAPIGDGFVLRDLASTNGTFCNGVRVTGEVALREGDRIGIGTSVFAFHRGH